MSHTRTAVYFDKYDSQGAYHWAECDRRYTNWRRYNPALDARYAITVRKIAGLNLHGLLLDVGCGDGLLMGRVAPFMKRVIGIDSETSAIRCGKEKLRRFPNCSSLHASCYDLPFQGAAFDVVTSADVIEHLTDPARHVQEMSRVLKSTGALVLTTPKWREDGMWDARHEKEYTPEELQSLLAQYFEEVGLSFFWPTRASQLYATRLGWRVLKLIAVQLHNPFLQSGPDKPERFGQSLAVCRKPRSR